MCCWLILNSINFMQVEWNKIESKLRKLDESHTYEGKRGKKRLKKLSNNLESWLKYQKKVLQNKNNLPIFHKLLEKQEKAQSEVKFIVAEFLAFATHNIVRCSRIKNRIFLLILRLAISDSSQFEWRRETRTIVEFFLKRRRTTNDDDLHDYC